MLPTLFFFLFASVLIISALMVVLARNPVHAVLFLILCFFNAAGLFVLLGAEFLAMLLVIVYVGAVAVLFLFVVMMLDIGVAIRQGVMRYLPAGMAVGGILVAEILFLLVGSQLPRPAAAPIAKIENTHAIGAVLYTDYVYPFQVAGLVLLVAMIGAIVLTLRHRPDAKRQNITAQLTRRRDEVVKAVKVASGSGLT